MKYIYLLLYISINILIFKILDQMYSVFFVILNFAIYSILIYLKQQSYKFLKKSIYYVYYISCFFSIIAIILSYVLKYLNDDILLVIIFLHYIICLLIYYKISLIYKIETPKYLLFKLMYLGVFFCFDFYTGFYRLFYKKPKTI